MEYQKMKAKEIIEKLESLKTPRSAWKKGVLHYAFFIMSKFDRETEIESEATLLNGAKDWNHASCSGCFNVEDEVIALTLCNKSELQITRDRIAAKRGSMFKLGLCSKPLNLFCL